MIFCKFHNEANWIDSNNKGSVSEFFGDLYFIFSKTRHIMLFDNGKRIFAKKKFKAEILIDLYISNFPESKESGY